MRKKSKKHNRARIVLRLPDLDHSKTSVLNSLSSPRSRRNYRFAMDQFISWYCSEPRLALNRTVVLRFRLYLESLGLAAATINQRLAAVRRLTYEAAGSGLLSPELAAGIRRVEGRQAIGAKIWKLAEPRTVSVATGEVRRRESSKQSRLGDDCNPVGLWVTSSRVGIPENGGCADPPGTLGNSRPGREGWACPHGANAKLGEESRGQMDGSCTADRWANSQSRQPT